MKRKERNDGEGNIEERDDLTDKRGNSRIIPGFLEADAVLVDEQLSSPSSFHGGFPVCSDVFSERVSDRKNRVLRAHRVSSGGVQRFSHSVVKKLFGDCIFSQGGIGTVGTVYP